MPKTRKLSFTVPNASERKEAFGKPTKGNLDNCVQNADRYWEPMREPKYGDWLEEHTEKGQTFDQFKTCLRNKVDKKRSVIYILPFSGDMDEKFLSYLQNYCSAFFKGMVVKVLPAKSASKLEVSSRSNPYTGQFQYNAGQMLKKLISLIPSDAYCMIGISKEDIYPREGWNFCFGLASVSNRVGVFSFARYDPNFCDDDTESGEEESSCSETELETIVSNKSMLHYRSCRVMAHEICHMFGIKHCIYYNCMMNGSNSSSESCRKPPYLCPVCLKKLQLAVAFDPVERYKQLSSIMMKEPVWKKAFKFYTDRVTAALAIMAREDKEPPTKPRVKKTVRKIK